MARLSPWWRPEVLAARRPALAARATIKAAVRDLFVGADFVEVETPILQVSPGNETHISAFATQATGADGIGHRIYLHTSPEFACKKLLAAGLPRLFTFAPVFRNRERGRLHHPEFTMLEWYRAYAAQRGTGTAGGLPSLDPLMEDAQAVLRRAGAAGDGLLRHRGATAEAQAEPEVVTVVEAFRRHAGLELEPLLPGQSDAQDRLAEVTRALGLRVAADDTWSDLFSKILSAHVEPRLGHGRATFLTRYPASEAALARLCLDDARFAERFELYVCGVELANAFVELDDPAEQRRRFEAAEAERARIYGETYPIDEDFLDALAIMPPACGIALGFDRLVMLATAAEHIEDVLWAPVAEPGA